MRRRWKSCRVWTCLAILCGSMALAGCSRNVAPPLPYDADQATQLRDEIRDFKW